MGMGCTFVLEVSGARCIGTLSHPREQSCEPLLCLLFASRLFLPVVVPVRCVVYVVFYMNLFAGGHSVVYVVSHQWKCVSWFDPSKISKYQGTTVDGCLLVLTRCDVMRSFDLVA